MKKKTLFAATALAALLSAPAFAQGGTQDQSDAPVQWDDEQTTVIIDEDDARSSATSSRSPSDNRGLDIMAGGGVEGYLGGFRGEVNPGLGWSVVARGQPTKIVGFELGYSGGMNEIDSDFSGSDQGATGGLDLVRNGGHAAVNVMAPTPGVQPYAMAGIGIDRYNFRGTEGDLGFQDDTSGSVPLGVGLRSEFAGLTADLRFNYDVMFDQEFSPVDSNAGDGRYSGLLHLGGSF